MDFRACFTASVFYAIENLIGDVLNIETAIGGAVISQDRFWQFVKTHLLERSLFFIMISSCGSVTSLAVFVCLILTV